MKNTFDELNSVIKSTLTIHDIYHYVMQTLAVKASAKKEAADFHIYFSLWEINNNNKARSENTMIFRVR